MRLHLKSPDTMLLEALWRVSVIPADFDVAHPIGSGPFKLVSMAPGTKTELARHDGYWNDGQPYLDGFTLLAFTDDVSRANAVISGQIDFAHEIEHSQYPVVKDNKAVVVANYKTATVYTINMNITTEPFIGATSDIRQACRFAADRQQLVDQVFVGLAGIANDLMCPSDPYYASDIPQRAFDAEKAKSLVQSSGKGSAEILLNTANTAPSIVELATAYCQQAQAVGINMKLNKIDPSVYFGPEYSKRQTSTSFWPSQPLSVQWSLCQLPESPFNATHWNDEELVSLFRQARAEADVAKRKDLFHQMQQIQYDRGTMVIPVVPNQVDVYSPKIGGYATEPLSIYPRVETLWLKS